MKTLHGLTKEECQDYLIRRMAQFHEADFSKYGQYSEVIKGLRLKSIQSLTKEIEEYFK